MKQVYTNRKKAEPSVRPHEPAAEPSFDALRTGAAAPTAEQMGHRVDLPDAMREKMENAFGADLSAVKLYESETVRDAGVKAVAQGSNIAFAPGVLDFSSYGGQAILGHELSHVVSQARGEVTGSGLLNDPALEARADREGAMAAAGQQIAVPSEAMSPVTAAPAAGPMQCFGKKKFKPLQKIDPDKAGKVNTNLSPYALSVDNPDRDAKFQRRGMKGFADELIGKYRNGDYDDSGLHNINNGQDIRIDGLSLVRMSEAMGRSLGDGYSKKQIIAMYDDLMAPHHKGLNKEDPEAVAEAQKRFDRGMLTLKGMHYNKLKRMEATYGTLPTQLHPREFMQLAGNQYNDHFHLGQDTQQMLDSAKKYFNTDDPKDQELMALHDYYYTVVRRNHFYATQEATDTPDTPMNPQMMDTVFNSPEMEHVITPEMEAAVHGPSLTPKKHQSYLNDLQQRFAKKGWTHRLFGKYRKPDDFLQHV